MGTIVYQNLVEFLLEEGNKTKEEIIREAIERFGFSRERLNFEIEMQLTIGKDFFEKLGDGKYKLLKLCDSDILGRKAFLDMLENSPQNYLDTRPHIKKLYDALENRMVAGL